MTSSYFLVIGHWAPVGTSFTGNSIQKLNMSSQEYRAVVCSYLWATDLK